MVTITPVGISIWDRWHIGFSRYIDQLEWYLLYQQAKRHKNECRALEQAILSLFGRRVPQQEVWITSATYRSAGRYGDEKGRISWLAPVGILLWLDKDPAFGVGIDFSESRIRLRQLTVAEKFRIPESLQDWPALILSACAVAAHECDLPLRLMRQPALLDPFFENNDEPWIDLFLPRRSSS